MSDGKNGEANPGVRPTILLVEDDDDARPGMRRMLEGEGYRVLVTLDEQDATERVSGGRVQADLILLNQAMSPQETLAAGRRIRELCEACAGKPVVVIASDYTNDEEGIDDQITDGEWITYLEDAEQLQRLLSRLTQHAA